MGSSTTSRILMGVVAVLVMASDGPRPGSRRPAPRRSIEQITGGVYTATNNNHRTVFLVTPEGILLGDPINVEFAKWLKAELATRFKVPVRYVVYSHHHWDHASGGEVFADTAKFVGHANMLTAPGDAAGVDHALAGHRGVSGPWRSSMRTATE